MEITWHDNTCFMFRDKKTSLVVNPHKDAGKLKANIVLSSVDGADFDVEGMERLVDWPGEYEMKDIPIVGFQAWTKKKDTEEDKDGGDGDETIIFCFSMEGVKFCHLGNLGHNLSSEMVKEIGDVDILMISVGKESNLEGKKAMEIIESIEPRIIIPMGSKDLPAALKEIGVEKFETEDKFVIKAASELPVDQMKYLVLARG